ncbi:hypothetical protein Pcinc_039705 [Petrolisthes cinctipes]|uniref:Uncharacterized protein n=1 Tax=Petrolisthes cinctipes TaxID=88211 RepID=A0AAE1BMX0_PETCI|nr:hypothetical protein Pcinc_039705 [Petrolisthes cinctipes]
MASYLQRPSPGRRCSLLLPPSEYSTCRPRSSSASVVDMKNFSPALTVSYRGAPHKPSCATPCFVSPRMAFTTQFSYDSPIQILTSSPRSMPRIRGLRKLSPRLKLLMSGLLLSLALVLYIFRVHVVAEEGLDKIGECSDKLSCTNTTYSLSHIQSILRSTSSPQQDLVNSEGDNIDKTQEDTATESGELIYPSQDHTPAAGKVAGQGAGDVDVNKDDLLPDTDTQMGERYRSKRHTVEGQYVDEDEQDGVIEDHTTRQQGGEVHHRQPKAPNQFYPEGVLAEDEQDYSEYGMMHDDYSVPPQYMQQQNYDDDDEQLPHYYPNTMQQQRQFMEYGHFNEENQRYEESVQQEKYSSSRQQEQQQQQHHQQQQDPYQHQQYSYNHQQQQQQDQYQQQEQYTTDQYIQHRQYFSDQYSQHQQDLQQQQHHHQSPQVSQDDALHVNTQGQQNDQHETRQSNQETTHQEQQRDPQYETNSTTTPRSQSQRKRTLRNGQRSNDHVEMPEGRDARLLQEEAAAPRMKLKPTTEARQNEARMKPQAARMQERKETTVKEVDSRVNRQLRRRESGTKRDSANSPTSSTPPRNRNGGVGRRDRGEGKTSQRIAPGINPGRYTHNDL